MMDCVAEHPYRSGRFGGTEAEPLRPGGLDLTRRAMQYAGFAPGKRVLDLGCGQGAGTRLLSRWGCDAIGLDVSTTALASATRRMPGLPVIAAGAHHLPFADESLDGILAECSLSLVERRDQALTECHRALRPGGRLAITDVFARESGTADSPLPTCVAGMARRDEILAGLADAGFHIERWEDHSAVLKAFVARLIFESDSSNPLWTGDGASPNAALRQRRPGYFLLVAAKATERT